MSFFLFPEVKWHGIDETKTHHMKMFVQRCIKNTCQVSVKRRQKSLFWSFHAVVGKVQFPKNLDLLKFRHPIWIRGKAGWKHPNDMETSSDDRIDGSILRNGQDCQFETQVSPGISMRSLRKQGEKI